MEEKRQPQPDRKDNNFVISPEIERHMQILRKDPKSPVFAILSEAYRKGGLLDEAIATALEGLKHNPNYISGRVALGRAYFDKGELDKAIEELKKVIKSTPDNIISHKLIADIYIKKSDIPSATQELKTILYLSPDDKEAKKLIDTFSKPLPVNKEEQLVSEPSRPEQPMEEPRKATQQEVKTGEIPETEQRAQEIIKTETKKPAEIETPIPKQQYEEKDNEIVVKPPVVIREPGKEQEKKSEEGVVQKPETESQKSEEAPVTETAGSISSVDIELEAKMSKPISELKTEEIKKSADIMTEPQKEIEVLEEKESLSPPAQAQDKTTGFVETKEEVKEEELEAVFAELTQATGTPQQEVTPPTIQQVERPQPAISGQRPAEVITETYKTHPEANEPEHTPPLDEETLPVTPKPLETHVDDIQTVTMADLYIKQGHLDKAYNIYRTILLKTPDSPVIRAKLIKVKKLMEATQQDELDKKKLEALKANETKPSAAEQPDTIKENMKRLNAWLEKIKKGG
jgi:tetratricopeptide (TPR) repeat protein